MNDLTVSILGFPAVNRDLTVELRDPVSNKVVREVQPFLDGTVRVPNIEAGAYELTVKHPNVTLPVLRRPIRVLPTGETKVSVLIDPSLFRNTPIEDIPDANLTPVRQAADSVAETVLPLAHKQPGESIKAQDWNLLASSVRDLAVAMSQLTQLVSPVGHDHPEFVKKFDEMQTNFETLINTLSAAMAELQRQIQTERFRKQVEQVLADAQVDPTTPKGKEFLQLVDQLDQKVTDTPTACSRQARNVGVQLATKLDQLAEEKPDVIGKESAKALTQTVELLQSQKTTSYDTEMEFHRKTDRVMGGNALKTIVRG